MSTVVPMPTPGRVLHWAQCARAGHRWERRLIEKAGPLAGRDVCVRCGKVGEEVPLLTRSMGEAPSARPNTEFNGKDPTPTATTTITARVLPGSDEALAIGSSPTDVTRHARAFGIVSVFILTGLFVRRRRPRR